MLDGFLINIGHSSVLGGVNVDLSNMKLGQ